ncbi:hypothetical protein ACYVOV_000169 [Vibrio cholerae]
MFSMIICFDVPVLKVKPTKFTVLNRRLTYPVLDKVAATGFKRCVVAYSKRVTLGLICMMNVSNAAAFSIGSDGTFSYRDADVQPRINELISGVADPYDKDRYTPGQIVISVSSDYTGDMTKACLYVIDTEPTTMAEIKKNNFALMRNAVAEFAEKPTFGGPYCGRHAGEKLAYLWIQITSKDRSSANGWLMRWYQSFRPNEYPTDPASCSASISGPMSFGIVQGRGPHTAESTVSVSCTKNSEIFISVNGGSPLAEPESGTEIMFDTVGVSGEVYSNKSIECEQNCSVRVIGNMVSNPSSPGAYKWYAPVIVEYK